MGSRQQAAGNGGDARRAGEAALLLADRCLLPEGRQ
jgi:hypothetical protein